MANEQRTAGGKNQTPAGISAAEVQQLKDEVARLKQLVQEHLSEKNQWGAEVRKWVGKAIRIHLVNGETLTGVLAWMDRYTIYLKNPEATHGTVIHKGAVSYLYVVLESPT